MFSVSRHIGLGLCLTFLCSSFLPGAITISGMPDTCYPDRASQVTSFAQIAQLWIPALDEEALLICSGLTSQASWTVYGDSYKLFPHKQFQNYGPFLDFSAFTDMSFGIAYRKGGSISKELKNKADNITLFSTDAEAVNFLKTFIEYYRIPLQVYVDFYYMHDEAADYYLQWESAVKIHQGRYVVVHGFDDNYIYYTDHCPTDTDASSPAKLVPISWDSFIQAWHETYYLAEQPMGPFLMVIPTNAATLPDALWTLLRISQDAIDAPQAIQACAAAIRDGSSVSAVLDPNTCALFADMRPYLVSYLRGLTTAEISDANLIADANSAADYYEDSAALWDVLAEDPNEQLAADRLDAIAAAEEAGLELLYAMTVDALPIALLSPADGTVLSSLGYTPFTWIALENAPSDLVVQIAANGDFSNKKELFQFSPDKGQSALYLTPKIWSKIIRKDNADRQVKWRVISKSQSDYCSPENKLHWAELKITPISPVNGMQMYSSKQRLYFYFNAPPQLGHPKVIISTNGNFLDKKSLVKPIFKPKYDYFYLSPQKVRSLINKDEGDGVVYWTIIDTKEETTTVRPSDIRYFALP